MTFLYRSTFFILFLFFPALVSSSDYRPDTVSEIIGGGGLIAWDDADTAQHNEINLGLGLEHGMKAARVSVFAYWDPKTARPSTENFNNIFDLALKHDANLHVLFNWNSDLAQALDVGGYERWYSIGRAYAQEFGVGGRRATALGRPDYGIKTYAAFNEAAFDYLDKPDIAASPDQVRQALHGLADGIHSILPNAAVKMGGTWGVLLERDPTDGGFVTAIAPLLNDGTLDGIDIHLYYGFSKESAYGLYEEEGNKDSLPTVWNPDYTVQKVFDSVKRAGGVRTDIYFYTDEYGISRPKARLTQEQERRLHNDILTLFWDTLMVVGQDGRRPATRLALMWGLHGPLPPHEYKIFNLHPKTKSPNEDTPPERLNSYGDTIATAVELARGMRITSVDLQKALLKLESANGREMVVWKNGRGISSIAGSSFTLSDIAKSTRTIEVHTASGYLKEIPVQGKKSITFTNLVGQTTYMFILE